MKDKFLKIQGGFLINTSEISYVDFFFNEDCEKSQMYIVMKDGKKFTIEDNIDGVLEDIKLTLEVEQ